MSINQQTPMQIPSFDFSSGSATANSYVVPVCAATKSLQCSLQPMETSLDVNCAYSGGTLTSHACAVDGTSFECKCTRVAVKFKLNLSL